MDILLIYAQGVRLSSRVRASFTAWQALTGFAWHVTSGAGCHGVGIITESDIFRTFTELLGALEPGIRLTVLAPNFKGSLAQISGAITQHGGSITAFNIFKGEDPSNWGAHIKVADMTKEDLLATIKPFVIEILDIPEM